MTDLSTQAQAIVNAYEETTDKYDALAAVIREVANQLQYYNIHPGEDMILDARAVYDLADELEQI